MFSSLYRSLARPILKYAAPVWSLNLIKDIESLEKVQRRASRLALKQKRSEMNYDDRCRLSRGYTSNLFLSAMVMRFFCRPRTDDTTIHRLYFEACYKYC